MTCSLASRCTIHDALLVELPLGEIGQNAAGWYEKVMELPFAGYSVPTDSKGPAQTWREAMDYAAPEAEPLPPPA